MTLCCDMKHYCFLVLVLSVYVLYDVHCNSTSGNLREILIDCFQKVLMNDTEQLFTLQKALLFPKDGGRCLTINVTVEGRIDLTSNPEYMHWCDKHLNESNSCIYNPCITRSFELSPVNIPGPATTLVDFLGSTSIVQALAAMDPSFHALIIVISNDFFLDIDMDYQYHSYNYFDLSPYNSYEIYMTCTVGNIDPFQIDTDVTDAVLLYDTLLGKLQ